MFLDYPYSGMDFWEDPDIGLPFGYVRELAGMIVYVFSASVEYL